MSDTDPGEIEVHVDRDTVSASTVVDAVPADVFDYVRQPANHPAISGDNTVREVTKGPARLGDGDSFGMHMKVGVPYRVSSKVVEFEADRRLAWCHFFGHRWRWEVEPAGDGQSKVTETFDLSTAKLPAVLRLTGFPGKHTDNVRTSVANVAAHFRGAGQEASSGA